MTSLCRTVALCLALTSALAVACSGAAALPAPPAARETPPPTAYIGVIATPAPSTAPPSPATTSGNVSPDAAFPEALEQARASSAAVDVARTVRPPAPAAPVAVRVDGARARVVDRVATGDKRVALTFDAGADRGYAEQILDTLRDMHVQASFGMTGQWAEANPDLLRRMVTEGHHLINHTQSHDSFTGLSTGRAPKSAESRVRELDMTEAAVQRIAGATTKPYFRPPYGDLDASVSADVYADGYDVVAMWSVDSLGWKGVSRSEIEARCLRLAAPGAVYVFHVGSAAQDGPALAAVIEGLRRQGYQMGTLDWLMHQ